ncbi:auxin-responsive protein SAUR71-like [Curcuma longa]|uniref:auxin-responsive protein SAUR71-like n=1 Tax=Curcuma longa TaxID=136217 RepID=UPI003D9E8AF1
MFWRRKEKAAVYCELCMEEETLNNSSCSRSSRRKKMKRGYVPVLVGEDVDKGSEWLQRFEVHVKVFREPSMAALLAMAEEELGHRNRGVIRIPCNIEHFRQIMSMFFLKSS